MIFTIYKVKNSFQTTQTNMMKYKSSSILSLLCLPLQLGLTQLTGPKPLASFDRPRFTSFLVEEKPNKIAFL